MITSVDVCLISISKILKRQWREHSLAGRLKRALKRLVNTDMNGYFPSHGLHLNFIRNPCPTGFIPAPAYSAQYISPNQTGQLLLAQHQLQTGVALASLAPQQQLQLRAQLQGLGRVLVQQQFMQNYSFTNSSFYHQIPQAQNLLNNSTYHNPIDPAYNVACANIKDEILKQLNSDSDSQHCASPPNSLVAESVGSNSTETSCYSSPSSTRSSSPDLTESIMESRGLKRQLDVNHSPDRKRTRSGSDDDLDHNSGNLPFHWPGPNRKRELNNITQTIWKYFEDRHQTPEVYQRKMQLREALYAVMKGVFPYCGLYVVGSSMNGFGNETSDMDMCLMISQSDIDQRNEATEILRCLLKALRKCSFLYDITLIRAKVPILKFTDQISGVDVDLNINNAVGIRNTHLLNAYARLDWRVAPLVLFIKHWASQQNINDASQSTISSYSLVLMVVHFLQCGCNPPVLPSLQQLYQNKFHAKRDIRLLTLNEKLPEYVNRNNMSLGELFVGFLHYYSFKFDYDRCAISIRLGKAVPRQLVVNQSDNPNQWKCLCIEEPFDLSNTSRSVYNEYVFQRCRRVFKASFTQLRQTGDIKRIINNPV